MFLLQARHLKLQYSSHAPVFQGAVFDINSGPGYALHPGGDLRRVM